MFKKKYKRSEWMEGLLWVENAMKWNSSNQFFVEHTDGMQAYDIYIRRNKHDAPYIVKCDCSFEFGQGVLDYIEYHKGG